MQSFALDMIINANQLHQFCCDKTSIYVVVHFSRGSMKNLVPDIEDYCFNSAKSRLQKEELDAYFEVCEMLKKLPLLYALQPSGYRLKS